MEDAKLGRQTSIFSPAFYTHRHGYKLLVRLCLNGSGAGKGSHLSAFLVLAKGDFDALLPWPLRRKCTLTLLDQSEARAHICDSFATSSGAFFQRPTCELNAASGLPLFCPLAALSECGRYVAENTLFFRAVVAEEPSN